MSRGDGPRRPRSPDRLRKRSQAGRARRIGEEAARRAQTAPASASENAFLILVDTSVWVDHLRRGNARLEDPLRDGLVLVHPFVVGELALGQLKRRSEILGLLGEMPRAPAANHDEVLEFVDRHELAGGVGWIDVHLLVSAALSGVSLWTLDRRLSITAGRLALSA